LLDCTVLLSTHMTQSCSPSQASHRHLAAISLETFQTMIGEARRPDAQARKSSRQSVGHPRKPVDTLRMCTCVCVWTVIKMYFPVFSCGSDGQPPPTKHACMRLLTIPGVFNTDTATRPRLLPHHPHHVRSPPPGLLDHLPSLHPGTATKIFSQP